MINHDRNSFYHILETTTKYEIDAHVEDLIRIMEEVYFTDQETGVFVDVKWKEGKQEFIQCVPQIESVFQGTPEERAKYFRTLKRLLLINKITESINDDFAEQIKQAKIQRSQEFRE